MSAREFIAKVKVAFDSDGFKAGLSSAQRAYHDSFVGMSSSLESFQSKGSMAMQTATQLSLIASSTERYRQSLQASLGEPVEAASKLESSLAAVSTVVTPELALDGNYEKTLDTLRDRALAWGLGTAEGSRLATASADEFTATTYSMLSAGLEAEAAMDATSQAYILAKGTMGDASDAANLLAMAYNTMGDKGKDSGKELQRLSDVVAKTQAAFQIANLGQLSEGLKYAIPVAQKYKIQWEEISTLVGQLNTSGLTGSMAGTSFSSMMAQMLKASQSLGFEIEYDETGNMSVIGTLQNIKDKFGEIQNMPTNVRMAFDTAFGQEGSRALTLLMTSLDSLDSNYLAVANSEGQATMMAERMSDTYADRIERMDNARASMQAKIGSSATKIKGSFAGIKTSFYNMASTILSTKVGSAIGGIASSAMVAADGLLGIGGTALNVAAQLATFVAMSQQVGGVMGLLRSGGSMVVTTFKGIGTVVSFVGKGAIRTFALIGKGLFSVATSIVSTVVTAAKAIGTAMWGALGPIGVIIAVIAAIGVAAFLVYKNWDKIKTFFIGLWDSIKNIFSSSFEWITKGVTGFVNTVTKPFKWLADKIGGLLGWKKEDFGEFEADVKTEAEVTKTVVTDSNMEVDFSSDIGDLTTGITDSINAFQTGLSSSGVSPVSEITFPTPENTWVSEANEWNLDWPEVSTMGEASYGNTIDFPTDTSWGISPEVLTVMNEMNRASYDYSSDAIAKGREEKDSTLSSIKETLDELLKSVKEKKSGSIKIENLNLPNTDDIQDVIRFVHDLRDQIDKEEAWPA